MIDLALNGSTSYLCKVDFLLQRLQTRTRFFITIPIAGMTRIVKDHCRSFFLLVYELCRVNIYLTHRINGKVKFVNRFVRNETATNMGWSCGQDGI